MNTYVGCQMGCAYCYVRFFIKDKTHDWGYFVRLRHHVKDKLKNELMQWGGTRLVIGTMTDPYQPLERKHRITRAALQIINRSPVKPDKVGIFTRSPLIVQDAKEIAKLPDPRVHFSVSAFEDEHLHKIEPIGIPNRKRFGALRQLAKFPIKLHVSLAPCIPGLSEDVVEGVIKEMGQLSLHEFFIDPIQPYRPAFAKLHELLKGDPAWEAGRWVLNSKDNYRAWKKEFRELCQKLWKKHGNEKTTPIWCDHANGVREHLLTGANLK
jgi:DNA repair photolyase